jgi:hypothetical protein
MRPSRWLPLAALPLLACSHELGAHDDRAAWVARAPSSTYAAVEQAAVEREGDALDAKTTGRADEGVAHADEAAKSASRTAKDERPRIGALGPHTWIWKKPERTGLAIGKMRIGTSVALKSTTPAEGPGCQGKWYAIEPRGYVCDDNTATLNLDDPYYKVLEFSAPGPGHWPYRYAHSNGAPMYGRVPTPDEWKEIERDDGPINTPASLGEWARGHEELILREPIRATDEVPYFLRDGKRTAPGGNYDIRNLVWRRIPAGSMVAYSRAFEANGRVWLLTPDSMVVPADRVSDLKRSEFRGVRFDESELKLPFAWNRAKKPIELYTRDAAGAFVKSGRTVQPKSLVEIRDGRVEREGWGYYELRHDPGLFLGKNLDPTKGLDVDVVVSTAVKELPKGIGPNERWIDVRILSGTLTAYEGLRPVMATMFSPGKGGPPRGDFKFPDDHSKYATTALGRFPIEWKEAVATMSSEKGEPKINWFTDVPNQQYLKAPLAMHVTYWHEDFGKRKSAECVNVSPLDGDWLFDWTLPNIPEGWNAVRPGDGAGPSTPILVTAQ